MRILGIILAALGVLALLYGGFRYTTRDRLIDVGPLKVDAERTHDVPVAPIAGGLMLAAGAALLFGGAGAVGPALQSVGIGWGYHLFNTVPYVLTLVILVLTCKPGSVAIGSPGELSSTR